MAYRLEPRDAPCPACHATSSVLLYAVAVEDAAQHYVRRELEPERHDALRAHIETLWGGLGAEVLRCRACGFGFADPFVAGDERFYTLAYQRTGYPGWKWEFERTLAALRSVLPDLEGEPRVLEVGAGDGAFVKALAPALVPKGRVLCTEFSAYGRAEIERYGIECVAVDVRDLEAGEPFGVVCMFQVLEHLDRLDDLFRHLGTVTAPGARLFAAVPNDRRIAFDERHGGLLDLPPNHVGRWTRPAFQAIAARHGWAVLEHETEPDGAASRALGFGTYRYMRRRQVPGSLAQRAERLPGPARKAAQAALAGAYLAGAPGALAALVTATDLGAHQWVHLRRGGTRDGGAEG